MTLGEHQRTVEKLEYLSQYKSIEISPSSHDLSQLLGMNHDMADKSVRSASFPHHYEEPDKLALGFNWPYIKNLFWNYRHS